MAKYASKDVAFFLVNGRDMRAISGELTYSPEAAVQQTDGFGSEWEAYHPTGTNKSEFTQNGFFDDAADSSHEAFEEGQGQQAVICLGLFGDAIGAEFTGMSGELQTKYVRVASRGDLHRANAEYVPGGDIEEGFVLFADTVAADTDTEDTPVDNDAGTDAGGAIYLQVSALTLDGYTNLSVTVEHSEDGDTWAELATFTPVTAAPAAERIEVSGDIDQYLAVTVEFTGSGTDPSASLMVGVARN